MRFSRLLAFLGALSLLAYVSGGSVLIEKAAVRVENRRMENVLVSAAAPISTPPPSPRPLISAPAGEVLAETFAPAAAEPTPYVEIRETTIQGGLTIKNETAYTLDPAELLRRGRQLRLPADEAQILIIHTHGSEAYTPAGLDRYQPSDSYRTEEKEYNIIRIGDELAARLEAAGLKVIHDREIYDSPSYTGSYTRSGEAVEAYLRDNPGICIVFDVHRDALDSGSVVYKTMAEEDGVCASQIMMLCGSDASGLSHPHWQDNLALALYLQEAVNSRHPSLMRPVSLVKERYNQHLCNGSLILEVGSSGNTLQEALAAIRLYADAAAPALLALCVEE